MAKIESVNNGESGLSARNKINTALESVEVGATITGDGNIGAELEVNQSALNTSELNNDANFASKDTTQLDWISGIIEAPEDKRYKIAVRATYAGAITQTTTNCTSGTCTAEFAINNVPLGGTANPVSTSTSNQTHSTSNTFAIGDVISILITNNAACVDMNFSAELEYNLL